MATIKDLNAAPKPQIKLSILDRVVSAVSPAAGLRRLSAKAGLYYLRNAGFIASRSPKRSMHDWTPQQATADQDIIPKLEDIRASCRDLAMNMPIASGALERVQNNGVGTGLKLQSTIDRKFLKLEDEAADDWERNTEREFSIWSESTECDASNEQNFYELQQSAIYNPLFSGDLFVAMLSIKRHNFPYSFKVKLIEADQCRNPLERMDGILDPKTKTTIIAGVERDRYGAPIAYHFKNTIYNFEDINDFTRVEAFGESGLRNVLHLYERKRPMQSRGIPMLAPVVEPLKQLVRYSDAELMGTIISSFFTVFIKTKTPGAGGLAPNFGSPNSVIPTSPPTKSPAEDDAKGKIELAPGIIHELGTDEDISIADPHRPNEQFEPFFLSFVKQIGSALSIPFEELMLHFSASYSASRAAILQAWKFYMMKRELLCWKFCNPVYLRWLTEAVSLGRIDAPGFFEDIAITMAWAHAGWRGPGMGQIDPKKETEAAKLKIDSYLSTREKETNAMHGGSTAGWEGIFNRNVNEQKMIRGATKDLPENKPPTQKKDDSEVNLEDLEDNK